ncbi:MAG: peptidylprolyl isomerase [Amylibacter sp.]|nr:peptidylprolyl isomerase [Amylibacter sp.]|tara:strand:- start:1745 stop:2590 length:846 start_codon:yes stop_codon:yes gene_type:complete
MNLSKKIFFVAILATTIGLPIVAQDVPTSETVVAIVEGKKIKLGHIISIVETLPAQYADVVANDLYEGILDQLIQQTLLVVNVPAKKINEKRISLVMENERRALISSNALSDITQEAVTESALQDLYEDLILSGEPLLEFYASHILVDTEEEAQNILMIAKEGSNFSDLAKENSTGPSASNGGDLGWFGRGAMVSEFDEAVSQMKVGDISGPVKTQFGWHIIKLNDQRNYPSLETKREELEGQLRNTAISKKIEFLQDNSAIEVFNPTFNLEEIRNSDLLN